MRDGSARAARASNPAEAGADPSMTPNDDGELAGAEPITAHARLIKTAMAASCSADRPSEPSASKAASAKP